MTWFRTRTLAIGFLLSGLCLAGGTSSVGMAKAERRANVGMPDAPFLVVTQNACRAFSVAQNRQIDRMRLCRSAWKSLIGDSVTNSCVHVVTVGGLRVESVNYIESNKVEAVFSVGH